MSGSAFRRELEDASKRSVGARPRSKARQWLFVAYDQLTDEVGPLSREDPRTLGVLLVECPNKAARRPYHKQKLAFVLTNLRHFAVEQARRGVLVEHVVAPSYAHAIRLHAARIGRPLRMMRAAERELRVELAELIEDRLLLEVPHEGWLTTPADFAESHPEGSPWRMDVFYRHVRRRLNILIDEGKPTGGKFSFDADNRRRWTGDPAAPEAPTFEPDAITREACALIAERMAHHPGTLSPSSLPATRLDASRAWTWAMKSCLPTFGPFEDAMSTRSRSLFHTRVSPLVNVLRLLPATVVRDVVAMSIELPSKEGFIRQVLGWREYVRHVHEATDGFRRIDGELQPTADAPGDGGWGRWSGRGWPRVCGGDGGSLISALGASRSLPPAYWGARSGLRCLDEVVRTVWEDGYSHHITRLMVLSNIAMLLDVAPRELTDWFWAAYLDAYDWVVEPNVHGMGSFGLGDRMTTKPYVAGSAYIAKMSDYCEGCRFSPKTTCPLTSLYWAYLGRHRDALARVQRMALPLAAESRRTAAQRRSDARVFERVVTVLARGGELAL